MPHIILNLSDPVIGASMAASSEVSEALWVSPVVTAMAATRCANPIVSMIGAGTNADAGLAVASMVDPFLGRAWAEDRIGTIVDLGEVTWLVQADAIQELTAPLAEKLSVIPMQQVDVDPQSPVFVSLLAEVFEDLKLAPVDPTVSWDDIVRRVARQYGLGGDYPRFHHYEPRHFGRSVRQIYGHLRTAIIEAQYDFAVGKLAEPHGTFNSK